jgi:hypothetical protein
MIVLKIEQPIEYIEKTIYKPMYFVDQFGIYVMIGEGGIVTVCNQSITIEELRETYRISNDCKEISWEEFMKAYKETQYKIDLAMTKI